VLVQGADFPCVHLRVIHHVKANPHTHANTKNTPPHTPPLPHLPPPSLFSLATKKKLFYLIIRESEEKIRKKGKEEEEAKEERRGRGKEKISE